MQSLLLEFLNRKEGQIFLKLLATPQNPRDIFINTSANHTWQETGGREYKILHFVTIWKDPVWKTSEKHLRWTFKKGRGKMYFSLCINIFLI